MSEFGYTPEAISTNSTTWRSAERSFTVILDPRDAGLEGKFSMGSGATRRSFGVPHALTAVGARQVWPVHEWTAVAPETVEKFITELATIIQQNLATLLAGSDDAWRAAERLAADEARRFTAGIEARQLRRRAEATRATGDWQALGVTYERLLASGVALTPAEQARLKIAHKKQEPA